MERKNEGHFFWEEGFDDSSLSGQSNSNDNKSSTQRLSRGEDFSKEIDEDQDYAFALSLQLSEKQMKEDADINSEAKKFWKQVDEDFDHSFAVKLQKEYEEKMKTDANTNSEGEVFFQQIDEDLDFAFALSLQTQNEKEVELVADTSSKVIHQETFKGASHKSRPLSIVDKQWELIDPHPDIHGLFLEYDKKYFYGKLQMTGVEVRWSPRMTLCAGVCCYEGRGGLCSVRLSLPLLKLRPRKDLVETLLHEMIHAYLFVTNNNKDREGHGPEFLSHMNRINKETGARITVYHSFHDEVDLYRKHWWKCDGPCRKKSPFFGLVKRATNRAPGPNDNWWLAHQFSCGGTFTKIKEPDGYKQKKSKKVKPPSASESKGTQSGIRGFLKDSNSNKVNSASKTIFDLKSVEKASTLKEKSGEKSSDTSYLKSISSKKEDVAASNVNSAVKSSSIFDVKTVLSKEENVVTLNRSETSPRKIFIPFRGTGVRLGGSSGNSILSNSSHKRKDFSSSSGKVVDATYSVPSKLPRILKRSDVKDEQKDHSASANVIQENSKKLIQSPIEKFVTSRVTDTSSRDVQKHKHQQPQECDIPTVACPVCFVLVMPENINSHLDTCLSN